MSNTQLSASFTPVTAVIVTFRLQFTTTEGCPDTFDQIVYITGVYTHISWSLKYWHNEGLINHMEIETSYDNEACSFHARKPKLCILLCIRIMAEFLPKHFLLQILVHWS
jgi:hypothetical protein